MTTRRLLPAMVVCAVALAACGGGGSNKSDAGGTPTNAAGGASPAVASETTTTVDPFASTGNTRTAQGPPIGKIRIANLIGNGGQPGPAIDVYDTNKPASTDVALIKGLQYGQVSDYVTPHGAVAADVSSNLYAYPAGTLTPTRQLNGSNIDNSGFEKGDQMTLALSAPTGGLDGLAEQQVTEAGPRVNTSVVPDVPAGRGLLIVRDVAQPEGAPGHYLLIDGTCPSPVGQTSRIPVSLGSSSFALAPRNHSLAVTTSPAGRGLTTCTGATGTGTTHVTIQAGERVEAFVYGDPKSPSTVTAVVS